MTTKNEKPIVLMLIEGWGLSANWRGNAIASAKADNFQRFWNSYYHLVLRANSPLKLSAVPDPLANYYSISAGENLPDPHSFILDNISKQSDAGARLFRGLAKSNGALHLVGNISKNSEFGDLNVLDALIRLAKEQKIYRLYLHILADDSYKDKKSFLDRITELEQLISQHDLGEIATISGMSVASNENSLRDYIDVLRSRTGGRSIDVSQAVNHCSSHLDKMEPAILTDSKDAFIKDFDTVIFFNHQLDCSKMIINQLLATGSGGQKNKLNFTEIWTLVNFPSIYSDKINCLFPLNTEESLASAISRSKTGSFLISEADRNVALSFYFDASHFTKNAFIQSNGDNGYLSQWRKIINTTNARISDAIDSSQYSLIIGNYSVLPKLCRFGSFDDIVMGVLELDRSMLKLADKVLEQDGILFIASPYGLAEKVELGYKRNGVPLTSSGGSVPLIIVANNSQVSDFRKNLPKESINELISPRKDLTAIHRLLLLLLSKEGLIS